MIVTLKGDDLLFRPEDRTKKLEKRAGAEEIQIPCIRVRILQEAGSGISTARPTVLETGQPSLVERDRPFGSPLRPEDAIVKNHEPQVERQGNEHPPSGEHLRLPTQPGEDDTRPKNR